MSKIEVNTVAPQCGTTLTLGESGDTVTLGSGASQSGFGRTGTVDWDTTAKTASFTAVSGNGYFVNTTSGAITVTLPASPSAGDIVYIKDYNGNFTTNACTVARNSSNIRGEASDFTLEKDNAGAVFIYVDATEGWQVFADGSDTDVKQTFISATGGTITCCGDYKIHTFTGPGTFTVNCVGCVGVNDSVDYLVVAGGGGGGCVGGGGGAGGFRYSASTYTSPTCAPGHPLRSTCGLTVTETAYPITVGGGGSKGANDCSVASSGVNSVFSTITSSGGGGGAGRNFAAGGSSGGSGGGAASESACGNVSGGSGNTPPVSPPQGKDGGDSPSPGRLYGGGGGAIAAGAAGGAPGPGGGGNGGAGAGLPTAFGSNGVPCGSFRYYAGGGGGGNNNPPCGPTGIGGKGGGGNGQLNNCVANPPNAGTTNTGGGGGGGGAAGANGGAGAGGSGIVIIRYKFQ